MSSRTKSTDCCLNRPFTLRMISITDFKSCYSNEQLQTRKDISENSYKMNIEKLGSLTNEKVANASGIGMDDFEKSRIISFT